MKDKALLFLVFFLVAGTAQSQASRDPVSWDMVSDISGGPVAYGNGRFIAFGYSSNLNSSGTFISPTGAPGSWIWTGSGPDFGSPAAVAYGNGVFVSVGDDIETSPDGTNWTSVYSLPSSVQSALTAVIYAHGLFVAVGGSPEEEGPGPGIILTSSDGINWTSRGPSFSGELASVAYGNGLFVALGLEWFTYNGVPYADEGDSDLTSPDGINWVSHGAAVAPTFSGVAYGNGLFVEIAGDASLTSANGTVNLNTFADIGSENFVGAAYGGGWFVAVGDSIAVSTNGKAWTSSSYDLPSGTSFNSVTFLNDVFMAASDSGILRGRLNVPSQHAPPSILAAPQDQSVNAADSATFSVTASGSSPLSYQWLFNGSSLPGQTNSMLNIFYALPVNTGNYTVIVSNTYGSVTSSPPAVLDVQYPDYPTILSEPAATMTLQIGGTVELNVPALGDAPLTYQWALNGNNLAGATSSTLILSNVTALQDGNYAVTVSNEQGDVFSDGTLLTVSTLPATVATEYWPMYDGDVKYYSGPAGPASIRCVADPNDADFFIKISLGDTNDPSPEVLGMGYGAAGTTVYDYSAKPEIGATFDFDPPWLWFDNRQLANGGTLSGIFVASVPNYTNINTSGSVIVKDAGTVTVPAGTFQNCKLISTSGHGAILGSLNQSMVLAPEVGIIQIGLYLPTPSGGTRFLGWESLTGGTVGGVDVRMLLPMKPPTITRQPATQIVAIGSSASFGVQATGTSPLSYTWKRNGIILYDNSTYSGSATSNLIVTNAQAANAGTYTVVISNLAGSATSVKATLSVDAPPSITAQPTNNIVALGGTATFSVKANGSAPLIYHWLKDGINLVNGATTTGVTTPTLRFINVQTNNAGSYRVVVTNAVGSVTSSIAALALSSPFKTKDFAGSPVQGTVSPTITKVEDLPSGAVKMTIAANGASRVVIQTTTNLSGAEWSSMITNDVSDDHLVFIDNARTRDQLRFYRAAVVQPPR